jgi:tRNA A-37 threonylcarbamoyl transferase component Bud32
MPELATPSDAPIGTQHWHPNGPDLDERQRTQRWTVQDASIGEGDDTVALRRGDLLPGTRLRIDAYLGEGTTAIVYRGHHVDLGRPLAIKVHKDLDPDENVRERFLAEARLTSELDSDYVVDVLDFGRLDDGRLYYAMAYLEGQPLDELLDDGPMPVRRALPLLRMACKGLQQAHEKGIVHRDVKPENMMVVQRRNREQLVLVDFGIATEAGASGGRVCGTPYTMAPEQIEGRAVDARTDVYALGCCAFQMLTGRPFASGTTLSATLAQHLSEERATIDPSTGVPRSIARVIHTCLSLDPQDRYASASELEAALCEAQIAAGLTEIGKDLPLPDVDGDRRQRISNSLGRPARRTRVLGAGMGGVVAGVLMSLAGRQLALEHVEAAHAFESTAVNVASVDAVVRDPVLHEVEAVTFSFADLASAAALDDAKPPVPEPTTRRKARRAAPERAVLASAEPPERSRVSLLAFGDDDESRWETRSRARKLVREADRALRDGERRRAHDLYRIAARLGSRKAHNRLEDIESG